MEKKQQDNISETPAALGFSMPAEWEPHEATWLAWPHNAEDWPEKLDAIRWVYGEMARKITPGERVRMLVRNQADEACARRYLGRAGTDTNRIEFLIHPTNRAWVRDSGPLFVRRPAERNGRGHAGIAGRKFETAIVHFHFNAWAKYDDWRKDRHVPETAAQHLRKRLFNASFQGKDFTLEGGGIDVNGRGALLTTEECYLDPQIQNRNPGLRRAHFEQALRNNLGVTNILWLAAGPAGDDTHGHVDDVCRFVNPSTMVLIKETNRKDINFRPLGENWERVQDFRLQDGSKPNVIPLPMPEPLFHDNVRLPASYANFYICNHAVIVPTFNDPNDRVALGILGELFKDRPVVGIHAVDLVLGFGSLHCLTQQQPA